MSFKKTLCLLGLLILEVSCMESGSSISGNFGQNPLQASLSISVADAASVSEGESLSFKVSLSQQASENVSFSYQTENGTAIAGTDYTTKNGSEVFLPGEVEKTITVDTIDNAASDGTRQLSLVLSQVSGASANRSTAVGSIGDNEPTTKVEFLTSSQTVSEIVGTVTVTVRLTESSSKTVSVPYTLSGTATATSDYTFSNGTATFAPGETSVTLSIPIVDDVVAELVESLVITLGTPTNALQGTKLVHTITITDND